MDFSAYIVPLLLLVCAVCGLRRKVDVCDTLAVGAGKGLQVVARILPTMTALL